MKGLTKVAPETNFCIAGVRISSAGKDAGGIAIMVHGVDQALYGPCRTAVLPVRLVTTSLSTNYPACDFAKSGQMFT